MFIQEEGKKNENLPRSDCAGLHRLTLFADPSSHLFMSKGLTCTVKPVLETTCIKQSTALRDHCFDATPLL